MASARAANTLVALQTQAERTGLRNTSAGTSKLNSLKNGVDK